MFEPALRRLASLKLTAALLIAFGGGVLAGAFEGDTRSWWCEASLAGLVPNLLAALAVNPRLRRQRGLLVFHAGLAALLVLAVVSRMTRFQGQAEVITGEAFDGSAVTVVEEGPWHRRAALAALGFEQHGFRVEYGPHLARGRTHSEVLVAGKALEIDDTHALDTQGYRFVLTPNKGYALIVSWLDERGGAVTGAVNLPSFPLRDWNQRNEWRTPAGEVLELALALPRRVPDDRAWVLDSAAAGGDLVVTVAGAATTLRPGATLTLSGGRLRFEGVRMWLGYRVRHEPLLPWMFAIATLALAGLGAHCWQKLGVRERARGFARDGSGARA